MPTVATWTARLFFASIGFTIPVRELFSVEALYFGLLLTLIAIASKVATGIFEWDDKWAIGWAMVGRGELGFVMAEEAFRNDLTSKLTYSVTVWALLLATLLSPVAFRKALSSHHQMSPEVVKSPNLSEFDNEGQVEVVAVVDSKCEKVL
jgi:Kef-type K+ transport system membrane component KefB